MRMMQYNVHGSASQLLHADADVAHYNHQYTGQIYSGSGTVGDRAHDLHRRLAHEQIVPLNFAAPTDLAGLI